MRSAFLRCCLLFLATFPGVALGHGAPPTADAVLSHDAQGPRAVRLSAGVALRRAEQRYQFICPAAWGDQFPAPVAALSDGSLLVGASSGLTVLHEDGTLRAHPDPAATGPSSDIVQSAVGTFVIRSTGAGSELLRVDARQLRVLWTDPKAWYALAAFGERLVLLRGEGLVLEQVVLSASSGEELERQAAVLDQPIDQVFARANEQTPHALLLLRSNYVLGTVRMNAFETLASGLVSVAGPLALDGDTLLAVDGALAKLADLGPQALPNERAVHCLLRTGELAYACDTDGIARLSGLTVGEPLFRMRWLSAPDLSQVAEGEARSRCSAQWQDLRADLALVGTTLLVDVAADAGAPRDAEPDSLPEAGISAVDAQTVEAAAGPRRDADQGGCSVWVGGLPRPSGFLQVCCLMLFAVLVRRFF